MQNDHMTIPASPPEAQGPAIEGPAGEAIYGHNSRVTVVHDQRRDPAERDREMAEHARNARCKHCMYIPAEVLVALTEAIRTAAREGRQL